MSLKTASQNRASNFTFTNSRSGGGGGAGTGSVTITSIVVTDSGFNNLDDNAVGTSNSYIKIIGTGFSSSANVFLSGSQVSSVNVTYVNSTEIRVTLPSLSLGNTNIFVFNPDYSGAIWAPGITVSGFPDFTQTSYTSSTPLEVSVQLLATGDAPLTYALQAGSSLPSGCSLSSSGLITGTTTDGVYQFTVIVSDAQLQSFQYQITLTITSTDAYFNRTVLAINGDADTFVKDASSNSFAITVNGDTKPSAFSPYNTNWSNEFDGTGDSLSIAGSAALSSTGDFTIEGWGYFRSISNYTGIFSMRNATNAAGASINILNTGNFDFSVNPGGEYTATAVPLNRWFHVALVRSGSSTNNISCYLDGVRIAQFTSNSQTNGASNAAIIGRYYATGTDQYHANGFISNVRYVNGTALYSGATITVPTSPLTAVTNTAILTCQSNRLIDNSTNNFTITKNGDTKVSAFGPFTETDTTTGSTYFDGTGDYLTAPSNTAFTLGSSGDFTIECWFYLTASPSNYAPLMTTWTSASNSYVNRWGITFYDGKLSWFTDAGNLGVADSSNIALNTWIHVAVVRNGSTITMYKNGVSLGTQTTAQAYTTDNTLSIGYIAGGAYITGYISNARIIKGTAVYTSAFTPPTAALTAIANTSLLTLQTRQPVNNHTFIDVSGNNNLITRTGNASQGSFSPFSPAGWSGYFDGTGDYLKIGTTNATLSWLNTAGSVGTIEAWIYPTAFRAGGNAYTHPAILGMGGTYFNFGLANGVPRLYWWTGSPNTLDAGSAVSLNTWTHIALVFNGSGSNNLKMYVNGTLAATGTFTNINWASAAGGDNVYIGTEESNGSSSWIGYISNLRIVNGTALYTSTFTPPTSALTAVTNTILLACQSNRFRDNSTNNYTITRNGDAAVVNFSPFAPTAAYSPITHGGSAYFDATGDYTTATGNSLLLGSNNFTIEGWFYFNNGTENTIRVMCVNYSAGFVAGSIFFGKHNNNSGLVTVWIYNHSSSGPMLIDPTLPPTKEWVHYAVVRSGNAWALYRNGVSVATATSSASLFSATNNFFNVGGSPENSAYVHNGYISGFKITNGTALYTSNFSVPTSPATTSNSTSLLLGYNNAAIVDASSRNNMECIGDAKIVTSIRKYGTGSMSFDGTGDYLLVPNSHNFDLSTVNFTIELWVKTSSTTAYQTALRQGDTWTTGSWSFYINDSNGSGNPSFWSNTLGTSFTCSGAVVNDGNWHHVALVRNGSSFAIYIDGISRGTLTNSGSLGVSTTSLWIGRDASNVREYNGQIDDLRITKFARYTANFTPPTSTFLAQ